MSRFIALTVILVLSLVVRANAVEIGATVVTVRECELKEGGVVVKKARIGEQFSVQGVDGHRLLLGGAGSVWADDVDFLPLEAADEYFSDLIKKDPADWQALCARGRARAQLGLNTSGMNDLDEAVRLHPSCESYRRRAGGHIRDKLG